MRACIFGENNVNLVRSSSSIYIIVSDPCMHGDGHMIWNLLSEEYYYCGIDQSSVWFWAWEQINCCSLATCMLKRVYTYIWVVVFVTFPERRKREKERPQIFILQINSYYLYICSPGIHFRSWSGSHSWGRDILSVLLFLSQCSSSWIRGGSSATD